MQQPTTPLGSAREISPRKKKGQISFAQSSFMSSIGDDDTINEKKVHNDIEYMYQALRKSKADNELLMARNRQLAADLEEVLSSFKETSMKASLEQEAFTRTLRQEKNNADKRLVKATLKCQDRENLLLDWVNSVVSNGIDEKYKYLADLTQRTGVMMPKAHKLAQYICQQQGRPLRTAAGKGGGRRTASRGADKEGENDEDEEEQEEDRVSTTPLLGERLIGGNSDKKSNKSEGDKKKNSKAAPEGFNEDLSVLQNFKKLEESVSDLASGYANYITTTSAGVEESDAEKGGGSEVKKLFSGSEQHTYHSKALPSDEVKRSEAEKREKAKEQREAEEGQRETDDKPTAAERSPRSAAGKPPKSVSSSGGAAAAARKPSSPLRGGGSRGKPRGGAAAAVTSGGSGPASRKGARRSAGHDSNQESDNDNHNNEPRSGSNSRVGSAAPGGKKKKKPKSRGSSSGGVDYDDLVNNEDDDESMYRLDRVVGEALFDFNILNMNLRGTCGTPQDAVVRSLSGTGPMDDDLPRGAAGGAGGSNRDSSSYSLYTSSRGKYSGGGGGVDDEGLQYSPDTSSAVAHKTPRNGVFNYDGVVDNILSAVSEMNRSLTIDDDVRGSAAAASAGSSSGKNVGDKYWWDVANKEGGAEGGGEGNNSKSNHNNNNNDEEMGNEEDAATLLNTAINSARMAADNIILAQDL